MKKPFVADNGISFRCPEVACGRSAGTKSTDIYCLGLVILWVSGHLCYSMDNCSPVNEIQVLILQISTV